MNCIICAEKITVIDPDNEFIVGGDVKIIFGYGSEHDMEQWKGHICDSCATKIKGNMEVSNYM